MDIAAIGLLSFLASEKKTVNKEKKTQNQIPIEEKKNLDGSTRHNNMNHYYSGSQPPGLPLYSNKLSIHTGSNMMEHGTRNCRPEPNNLFKPLKGLTNVNGSQINHNTERYSNSSKMNNVLPFEQVKVGPGLNIGSDTDFKGGYHQFYRELPQNINGYRKNNHPQRIIPGRMMIVERPKEVPVEAPKYDRYYEMEERPLEQTKFQTNAYTKRSIYDHRPSDTEINEVYFGGAYQNTNSENQSESTRIRDTTESFRNGNLKGNSHKHNSSTYLISETNREDENCVASNVTEGFKTYARDTNQTMEPTIRSTTQSGYYSNAVVTNRKTYLKSSQNANGTHRADISAAYEGNPYGLKKKQETRDYNVKDTHRESTSHSYGGPSKYFTNNQVRDNNQEQYTKKEDTLIGYSPGPQKTSNEYDPQMFISEYRNDDNKNVKINFPMVNSNGKDKKQMGIVENNIKIPVENDRNFFSVANIVLKDNPYTIKIN